MRQMSSKEELLMHSLSEFYKNKKNIEKILPIINQKSNISLRLLDWFVTNYSKKNKTIYKVKKDTFNVHLNYKHQLKSYSKKQFDPFCRRDRIIYRYDINDEITTTVGQLCFFRWAIQNKIIDFVDEHYKIIEIYMNISYKQTRNEGARRSPLSINASKTYTKTYEKIIVSFD
jgi:c-di-GMP-related signal transduction protein